MQRLTMLTVVFALVGCTTTPPKHDEQETTMADDAEPSPATVSSIEAANAQFVQAYDHGEVGRAVAHYATDAVWYLTNGTALSGRAAIASFVRKAHADGAGGFEFSEREVRNVGDVRYSVEHFAFDLAPQTTVRGTRYGVWKDGALLHDAWVPDASGPAPQEDQIRDRTRALAAAYNSGESLDQHYTDDATIILSNGTVIRDDALGPMLAETAAMGISDMSFGAQRVFAAGSDAAYSVGAFSVTLPTPDGGVPIRGERLLLWRKADGQWRVALEMSWPASAPTRTTSKPSVLEAGQMRFQWHFERGKLIGEVRAPTSGWVAVGFNDTETLAGSRLVMARISGEECVVEEHYANPPHHFDIRNSGAPATTRAIAARADGSTMVRFELDPRAVAPANLELTPGKRVWVTLAYSDDVDFDHHSRFRVMKRARL